MHQEKHIMSRNNNVVPAEDLTAATATEKVEAPGTKEEMALPGAHEVEKPAQDGENLAPSADEVAPADNVITEEAKKSILVAIAEATLKEHNLDEVHVTADGQAFYALSDAHNHARNLADDTIISITASTTDVAE